MYQMGDDLRHFQRHIERHVLLHNVIDFVIDLIIVIVLARPLTYLDALARYLDGEHARPSREPELSVRRLRRCDAMRSITSAVSNAIDQIDKCCDYFQQSAQIDEIVDRRHLGRHDLFGLP